MALVEVRVRIEEGRPGSRLRHVGEALYKLISVGIHSEGRVGNHIAPHGDIIKLADSLSVHDRYLAAICCGEGLERDL